MDAAEELVSPRVPTLLTGGMGSGNGDAKSSKSGGTYSCEIQADTTLEAVRQLAKWDAQPWTVERAIPEVGDLRKCDLFTSFGHVKTVEKCLKYESTDVLYMHEYRIEESTFMPVGYVGTLQVTTAFKGAKKVSIVYTATWDKGEVSDAAKESVEATLKNIAAPQGSPGLLGLTMLSTTSWDSKANSGSYSCELRTDKTLQAVRDCAKWDAQPWSVQRAVPQIGDLRKCDLEMPGFGRVQTVAKCLEYESTDTLYMHKYSIEESTLMPVGYLGTLRITTDSEAADASGDASKVFIAYKSSWKNGKLSDAILESHKARLASLANMRWKQLVCGGLENNFC